MKQIRWNSQTLKIWKYAVYVLALMVLFVFAASCGPGGSATTACVPNVIDNLQLDVTQLSTDVYSFEICTTPSFSGSFTVYGGMSSGDVSGSSFNVAGAQRPPTDITDVSAGSTFQITFNGSDTYFAIYPDLNGNPDNSQTPLVSAHLLPGH